jgi:hypothetical protein
MGMVSVSSEGCPGNGTQLFDLVAMRVQDHVGCSATFACVGPLFVPTTKECGFCRGLST